MDSRVPDELKPRLSVGVHRMRDVFGGIVFIVAVFTLLQLAIPRSVVYGTSMQPNLREGQRLIISRVHYLFQEPQRGEIIVLNTPNHDSDDPSVIKRIIGMPGESVEMVDQQVYINGVLLDEPYIKEVCRPTRCPDNRWTLGSDQYFVLGDNRNSSRDSRAYGPISTHDIIGQAVFRYWPLSSFGIVHGVWY